MKRFYLPFVFFLLAFNQTLFAQIELKEPFDTLYPSQVHVYPLGDLNQDRIPDTAFVFTPRIGDTFDADGLPTYPFGCENDSCYNAVRFSNGFPPFSVLWSVWGDVANAGDLNGDGISEILFCDNWFIGTSRDLSLFTLQDGSWKELGRVKTRHDPEDGPLNQMLVRAKGHWYLRGVDYVQGDETFIYVLIPNM